MYIDDSCRVYIGRGHIGVERDCPEIIKGVQGLYTDSIRIILGCMWFIDVGAQRNF